MTSAQIWTYIRWPIAIVLLAALGNYAYPRFVESLGTLIEFDASGSILAPESETTESETPAEVLPTSVPTLAPNTGPVTDGVSTAIADFFVNDTVADVDNESLILSDDPADAIVIAFEIPPGDPGCMSSMSLGLDVAEVSSTTELGVYASSLSEAATIVDNEQVDDPDLRALATPMATALVEQQGRLNLDVLAGFQSYFLQGFPPGTPFVLTIVPTIPVESQGGLRITALDAANEDVPSLSWVGTPGCPIEATPTPTQ